MLKEAGELDLLLTDLLSNMGIETISKPSPGVRQYGVDLAAVGPDVDNNGIETLHLFTIKRGHIRRTDWDSGIQSVRASLNEILDTYIPTHIAQEHINIPIAVVLCHGGDLGQDVQQTWAQFTKNNTKDNITIRHWSGAKLAGLIESYFLNDNLFPESSRKNLRKALALIESNDYDLRHYYQFLDETLFDRKLSKSRSKGAGEKRVKALRLIQLSLNILYHWADEEDNIKPALLASERTLLRCWDWIRQYNLTRNTKTLIEYAKLLDLYRVITTSYFNKIQPFCYTRDALFGYRADEVEYSLRVFEVIGILGTIGLDQLFTFITTRDEKYAKAVEILADALQNFIKGHEIAASPVFDEHGIDISLGLLLLHQVKKADAISWIEALRYKIVFAYANGHHYPISTDSFDDLLELRFGESRKDKNFMDISTILPMLAEWCAVLGLSETYGRMRQDLEGLSKNINLQLWYPDEETEDSLYKSNASHESGSTQSSIELPDTLNGLIKDVKAVQKNVVSPKDLSFMKAGLPQLSLIASRHFRTPVFPFYWQQSILEL